MPRGSRPGERRGGRQRGSRNKATSERELLAQRMLAHAPAGEVAPQHRTMTISIVCHLREHT
jgi:hypothetical protein